MLGYVAIAALALFGASRVASRKRRHKRRAPKVPTWETQVVYPGAEGPETLWIVGAPYTLERSVDDLVVEHRDPKNLANALELAADIASERVVGDDPIIRIDVFRYDVDEYVRRVVLSNFGTTNDGRAIAQAEISKRGHVESTRNYAAASVPEVVSLFLRAQLDQTLNEGLLA